MADRHVVTALRRKYAELKGVVRFFAVNDIETAEVDLLRVGKVLLMFSPGDDLSAIPAIRPYVGKRGHWTRRALGVLRTTGKALTTFELADRIIADAWLSETDTSLKRSIASALGKSLQTYEGAGIERASEGPRRWRATQGVVA